LPRVFKYINDLVLSNDIKSSTLEYLNQVDQALNENITNMAERIDNFSAKGCIAKERGDRELEVMIEKLQSQTLSALQSLQVSQQVLEELKRAVHSELFFDRFKQILHLQLGESEKRLIILYFVDRILVSPEQPLQEFYRQNVFESFGLLPAG